MSPEELKVIWQNADLATKASACDSRDTTIVALCAEVERLQKAVAEARDIIEHVGFIVISTEDLAIATKATTWMKENP